MLIGQGSPVYKIDYSTVAKNPDALLRRNVLKTRGSTSQLWPDFCIAVFRFPRYAL